MNRFLRHLGVTVAALLACPACWAIGWDRDDFLVTGGGTSDTNRDISIHDRDFTFKGFLDTDMPGYVSGFDFDRSGNLIAALQSWPPEVRVYDRSGALVGGFSHPELGTPGSVAVSPNGHYLISTTNNWFAYGDPARNAPPDFRPSGVLEFAPTGELIRRFDIPQADVLELLDDGVLWANHYTGEGLLEVLSYSSGNVESAFSVEGAVRNPIVSLHYTPETDTVLLATSYREPVELASDGTLLRTFRGGRVTSGYITRGPNGDVLVGDRSDLNEVFRWSAEGEFLGSQRASNRYRGIGPFLWTGQSVPEPRALMLAALAIGCGWCRGRD